MKIRKHRMTEDTTKEWKPNIAFNHIEDIYNRLKSNGYKYANNDREEFMAAVEKADKKGYKPEQCRKIKEWHREIWKAHKDTKNEAYEFSDDDFEDDIMHANVYGGDTKYCRHCGSVKEYDEDGFSYCPDCDREVKLESASFRYGDEEDITINGDTVELYYPSVKFTVERNFRSNPWYGYDYDEFDEEDSVELQLSKDDLICYLIEEKLYDFLPDAEGMDSTEIDNYVEDHLEDLVSEFQNDIMRYFEDKAVEQARKVNENLDGMNESGQRYYVTTYELDSVSGPEEGGYTSYGWRPSLSKYFPSIEDARKEMLSRIEDGDEIISQDDDRIYVKDSHGDEYVVAVETAAKRGRTEEPPRTWAEAEFGSSTPRTYFDKSGRALDHNPYAKKKAEKQKATLINDFISKLDKCSTRDEVIDVYLNTPYNVEWGAEAVAALSAKLKELESSDMPSRHKPVNEALTARGRNSLTEAPRDGAVDFKLPKDMLNNPDRIDLKGMASKAVKDKEMADAEAKRQAEFEANSKKYADLIAEVNGTEGVEKQLEVLFNALVPSNGKSDTVAGELVRAITRIMYRDYNDGDVFYEGYGLETCSGSVAYLIDTIEDSKIHSAFDNIASNQLEDDAYTNAINKIGAMIVSYILSNKSVWQPNTEDSRGSAWGQVYENDYREDWEPTYEYDFIIPPTIAEHMENGNCTDEEFADEIRSELENSNIEYDSVDVWSDNVYIYGLKRDDYDELESRCMYEDSSWDWFIENLNDQYGDPFEEDSDDDEEYDDDEL